MYEELIKALEGCLDCSACTECPIHGSCNGTFDCAAHIAADHIKAQAAEIVSLTAQLAEYQEIGTPFGIKTILAKKDAQLAEKDAEIAGIVAKVILWGTKLIEFDGDGARVAICPQCGFPIADYGVNVENNCRWCNEKSDSPHYVPAGPGYCKTSVDRQAKTFDRLFSNNRRPPEKGE